METNIELIRGDITQISADAIVNAANKTLLGGGGVDGAIHRVAGAGLLRECVKLGGCATGSAKITKGYNLAARYVIHTVGPVWCGGKRNEEELLASCYRESLKLAKEHNLKTIAFPSISTGVYRFPLAKACPIALEIALAFIRDNSDALDKIIFVLFSDNDFNVYKDVYNSLNEEANKVS
ncbi:MAG TPA: O-acetyl-ADP-ribose deacetylase [Candidatus Omnitrophica bacterium]|nr:O-acetyl-ADP-ribose deacetylase [Candidatus Omnitrophota bacterium]